MQIEILPNGNLKMFANNPTDRDLINQIIRQDGDTYKGEARFIEEFLPAYYQVKPEDVGALTDAPLIGKEEGKGLEVWGFMDYQVKGLLGELAAGNTVIWQKG